MTDLFLLLLAYACLGWMGDDDYHVRQAGTAILAGYGEMSIPVLAVGVKSPDPEVSRRCHELQHAHKDRILSEFMSVIRGTLKSDGYDAWPWIDSAPDDVYEITGTQFASSNYLWMATSAGFTATGPDFTAYREATRLFVQDCLWSGRCQNLSEAILLVRKMVDGDRRQCRERGYKWVGGK